MQRRSIVVLAAAAWLAVARFPAASPATLPDRLSDREFWTLVTDTSEPGGAFHSDNFTSNEPGYGDVVVKLTATHVHGGAYLGVGPEQNFPFILAIRPRISFIVDIRRQAVMQHLLFKALFELAADRVEFLSLLFSEPRPSGLTAASTAEGLWRAFGMTPSTDSPRYARNLDAVESRLSRTHGFVLSEADRASLEYVYAAFFKLGPLIDYAGYVGQRTTGNTNFAKLTGAEDPAGVSTSFLATEQAFQVIKDAETRNLIVPVEGDFAGPRAIRAVGDYLKHHDAVVSAFYISNVEQYLFTPKISAAPSGKEINGGWQAFYDNVATLPLDPLSVFIRVPMGSATVALRVTSPDGVVRTVLRNFVPLCPIVGFLAAVRDGRVQTQQDADACGAVSEREAREGVGDGARRPGR